MPFANDLFTGNESLTRTIHSRSLTSKDFVLFVLQLVLINMTTMLLPSSTKASVNQSDMQGHAVTEHIISWKPNVGLNVYAYSERTTESF